MESDYNRDHFDRRAPLERLRSLGPEELRRPVRAIWCVPCVSEFSGFLNRALAAEGIEIDLPTLSASGRSSGSR